MYTHAAITNLALSLPGWDSLDSVRRIHNDFEGGALIFFALLVVAEALAHLSDDKNREHMLDRIGIAFFAIAVLGEIVGYKYGQRNDELSEHVITSLDTKAGDALNKASQAHDLAQSASDIAIPAKATAEQAKGEADTASTLAHGATTEAISAKKDLEKVRTDVARVEDKYAPRTLSQADRDALITALTKAPLHPGIQIEVDSFIGATDGVRYATEIVDAINDPRTGWHARYGAQNTLGGNLKGLVLIVHDLSSAPPWTIFLQQALKAEGLGGEAVTYDGQPPNTVMILIVPKN